MVENLLASGQSFVNEMADSGTDLLKFTVSNENLKHKTEIVKTLLKYGADPAVLTQRESQGSLHGAFKEEGKDSPGIMTNGHMNAAMEYNFFPCGKLQMYPLLMHVLDTSSHVNRSI